MAYPTRYPGPDPALCAALHTQPCRVVAQQYGVATSTMIAWRKRLGIIKGVQGAPLRLYHYLLTQYPDGATMTQVARDWHVTREATRQLAQRLLQAGYVTRIDVPVAQTRCKTVRYIPLPGKA